MEAILVVGAAGNIDTAAVVVASHTGHQILAVIRNKSSADELLRNIGSDQAEEIITIEADITDLSGIWKIINKIQAGDFPHFQHVFSAAGGAYTPGKLSGLSDDDLVANMKRNFETNFYAYRATIPYLLAQRKNSS